jgi:serine/threonine protein kinase
VSDFGLTKFKTEMKKSQPNQLQGSLHWTAPEILNESDGVDYTLADVYSFGAPLPPHATPHLLLRANVERLWAASGIILWELATREQPYHGMRQASPLAVCDVCLWVRCQYFLMGF